MLDFTSSLYLGFWHASANLRPWRQLTTGAPAALVEPGIARRVAEKLAALQGCQRATLAKSTLHLFWDLFGILSAPAASRGRSGVAKNVAGAPVTIYLDQGAYPIAEWGVERAAGRGTPVKVFPHLQPETLRWMVERSVADTLPVVVTNGLCTCCGCTNPLREYLAIVRKFSGLLIIDDTQALGILGRQPQLAALPAVPDSYGLGGGGALRHAGLAGPDILVVSSLAKGFGTPLAGLSGSAQWIERYEEESLTRQHCSPPSMADLTAAGRALELNDSEGDQRRGRLASLVGFFKDQLAGVGLSARGGYFPIQTLELPAGINPPEMVQALMGRGVRSVLHWPHPGHHAHLSFIITLRHTSEDIIQAVNALAQCVQINQEPFAAG